MTGRELIAQMGGREKAAALMLAVGEDNAARVFSFLDDDEIKELSQSMAGLGAVDAQLVEQVLAEFTEELHGVGSLIGTVETTERLLSRTLSPERVQSIMDEIRGPAGRTMWDKLSNVNEEVLANYLKNEYPQTVALVLSKVKPEHAARVLPLLPDVEAIDVVQRMLRMENVQKEVLEDVERTLRSEFMSNLARTHRHDAHELLAEIFNNLDRATEARLMEQLEDRSRDAAEKIKALMFTFEDLSNLDPGSVQTLLRAVDKEKLVLALKGASETIRSLVFGNMAERTRKILMEELQNLGPVRLRDVDEAQAYVVKTAKDLATAGEIVIADKRNEDELIY
jgi:flagellar motor switch protein FliG